jgi:hypothetical protein
MASLKETGKLSDNEDGFTGKSQSSGRGGGFGFDFRKWDFEARSQRNRNSSYPRGFGRGSRRSTSGFGGGYHRETNRSNPEEAKRWMRQADADLKAAQNER